MNIKTLMSQAKEEGWHLREDYIEEHLEDSYNNINALTKYLLNQDLKNTGLPSLSVDLLKGKFNQLTTPIILQVSNVRNISAPKANEESGAAPRLLKVTLSDGISYVHGIEVQPIKCLSLKTAPGTKIKLVSKVPVVGGFLLLSAANVQLLGGEVEDLYKKWQMSQSASKYTRSAISTDGSGPPSWVPFGNKILIRKENNFNSLNNDQSNDKDDEFESQRKQVVQEISQGSSQKIFGGGKQMLDSNVQKVVNAGFSVQEAEWSLKRNKNDAYRAIQDLRGNCEGISNDGTPKPLEEPSRKRMPRGRGRGGRGRGRGGPDDSDEEDYVALSSSARPSGPASLLDFLESKILDKKDPSTSMSNDYSYNPKQHFRGREVRDRSSYGKRGSKNDRGKSCTKNQGEAIMSENWPSLQKNTEPEPVRKRDVSPNIYGRDYEEDEYNNYQEDRYNQSKNQRGNQSRESQNYPHTNIKENNTRYSRGSYDYNPKNFQDKNYENKSYAGRKQEFHNYRSSNSADYNSRYQSEYHGNTSQNYQDNSYKDRKPMKHYSEEFQAKIQGRFNHEAPQPHQYESNKQSSSYRQGYDFQTDTSARYKKPDQPIFVSSRGRQQHYDQTQNYRKQEEAKREPTKEHSTREKDLIAQFEKSMVMAGYYEPSESHSHFKNSYQSNNFNYEENRPPYNEHQSTEYYGSVEYQRGRGFEQRRGGHPRYGRGSRY